MFEFIGFIVVMALLVIWSVITVLAFWGSFLSNLSPNISLESKAIVCLMMLGVCSSWYTVFTYLMDNFSPLN